MWMLVPGWYFAALATGTGASSEPTKLGRAVATKPTARMAQANEVVIAGDIIDLSYIIPRRSVELASISPFVAQECDGDHKVYENFLFYENFLVMEILHSSRSRRGWHLVTALSLPSASKVQWPRPGACRPPSKVEPA